MTSLDLEILSRSPLLASLTEEEAVAFHAALDPMTLAAGTSIFREGEEGDAMFFVLEGEARLRRGQLELRAVHPGDHFGELAMLGGRKRAASVEAHGPLRLARLTRARFAVFAATHQRAALPFTQALASCLGDELTRMTDSVGLLVYQRSVPRSVDIHVRRENEELVVGTGTLPGTLLPREVDGALVVGATLNRKPASLETAIVSDVELGPMTLATGEGIAIYRRSAALLLLEAARRAAPGVTVRMGSPLESGQVVTIDRPADHIATELAAQLTEGVMDLVREDVPLREEVWGTDEARAHLLASGWEDAAALLRMRREPTVTLLACGETFALALGPVVPRASWLSGISLEPHPAGLLLRLGSQVDTHMCMLHGSRIDPLTVEAKHPRYGGAMSIAQRRWLEGFGVTSVGKFNEYCVTGRVAELIRVAEGFQEKWIGAIADTVAGRRGEVKVIVIAGPSSSGKTTFIKRLTVQLMVNGIRPVSVSLDDYYIDRTSTPKDANGDLDFEAFEALDDSLLQTHVSRLLGGERVAMAHYDFLAGKSYPSGGEELSLGGAGDVLLFEGIHGLNPALLGAVVAPESIYRIFVHPATTLPFDHLGVLAPDDARLIRRIVRDRHQRDYTAAETIMRWPSVRRGELCHIYPNLVNADVIFDSSLVYEMSVLKTYAERYLLEVPASHPAFTTAFRLRNLIDQFVAIYPDHVPPTSVLREFIGGSGFEY